MSQENVEIALRAITAINQRDVDSYLALCAPDVEMISPLAGLEGTDRGADGIRAFFSRFDESVGTVELAVERAEAVEEDRVLVLLQIKATMRRGITLDQPAASVYDLAEGKIRRVQVFLDRQAALVAVGLAE